MVGADTVEGRHIRIVVRFAGRWAGNHEVDEVSHPHLGKRDIILIFSLTILNRLSYLGKESWSQCLS